MEKHHCYVFVEKLVLVFAQDCKEDFVHSKLLNLDFINHKGIFSIVKRFVVVKVTADDLLSVLVNLTLLVND